MNIQDDTGAWAIQKFGVGQPVLRTEDPKLVRGEGRYTDDLSLPGQAYAAMDGRFSVAIDDVKKIAVPILRHRVSTNFQAQAEGKTSDDVVMKLLTTVKEPEPEKYGRKKA